MRGIRQRSQQIDSLGGTGRLADDMQSVRNQGVFKFKYGIVELGNSGLGRIAPKRLGLGQIEHRCLRLDQRRQFGVFGIAVAQTAPAFDR